MTLGGEIFAIISAIAAALTVIGSFTWWVYRRGESAGMARAEQKALEKRLTAMQNELDLMRQKGRRAH
jgi:hypothetical protein